MQPQHLEMHMYAKIKETAIKAKNVMSKSDFVGKKFQELKFKIKKDILNKIVP